MEQDIIKKYIVNTEGTREFEISFDIKDGEELVYVNNSIVNNYIFISTEEINKIVFNKELNIGDNVFITRKTSLIRQSKFLNNNLIDADKLNNEIDVIYKILNEFYVEIKSSLKFNLNEFDEDKFSNIENKKNKIVGYDSFGKLSLVNADRKNFPLTSIEVIKDIGLENYLKTNFENLNSELLKSYLNMGTICKNDSGDFLKSDYSNFDIQYIINNIKNSNEINKEVVTIYEEDPEISPVIKSGSININNGISQYSKIFLHYRYTINPMLRSSIEIPIDSIKQGKDYQYYVMIGGDGCIIKINYESIINYILPPNWYVWKVEGVKV